MKPIFEYICCFFKAAEHDNVDESIVEEIQEVCTCPIKLTVMYDPVLAADTFTYERSAIKAWFETWDRTHHDRSLPISPMTGLPLHNKVLKQNNSVKLHLRQQPQLKLLSKEEQKKDEAEAVARYEAQIERMQRELSQNPIPQRKKNNF
jgi:hypothetical protein